MSSFSSWMWVITAFLCLLFGWHCDTKQLQLIEIATLCAIASILYDIRDKLR